MKSVKETLTFFADALEAEKVLEFNMDHWYSDKFGARGYSPKSCVEYCGTAACIAGTVAMAISPGSKIPASSICTNYIIGEGVRTPDVLDDCLSYIFTEEGTYGQKHLADVTKDTAIKTLRELAAPEYSWYDLRETIHNRLMEAYDENS